ncbi:MAG TPA: hybrid sensor histidine kinase/response regulator [Aggregatilineales bacterium]|jgi:signal transduction histidine kinase|nr:hybrid sensor histidine kinase/response regulator [Aggregatilineales bacterium]
MTTILYIDDDPNSLRLVQRTLSAEGIEVLTAERGLAGIDLARRHVPALVLVDINLPDLTGVDITAALRADERFAAVPIVALTAQGRDSREWEMAFGAGLSGYIVKPIDVEALPGQVKAYLEGARDAVDSAALASGQKRYAGDVVGRLEQRIRELEGVNRELRHLDHMKDVFIEITAHELRTPLTVLYGYSRLFEQFPGIKSLAAADGQVRDLLKGMDDAIARMQRVVQEIVTVSRIMTDQIDLALAPTNLRALVEKAVRSFDAALALRRLTIRYDVNDFPAAIKADGDLLYLVLINLLSNAIKYTPDGGRVTLNAQHTQDTLVFTVTDTGIGIDPAQHGRIFEPFHTTAGDVSRHSTSKTAYQGGGIGLGLAICKGIIEAHGGQISVASPGHDPEALPGSTFTVTLPINPPYTQRIKQV